MKWFGSSKSMLEVLLIHVLDVSFFSLSHGISQPYAVENSGSRRARNCTAGIAAVYATIRLHMPIEYGVNKYQIMCAYLFLMVCKVYILIDKSLKEWLTILAKVIECCKSSDTSKTN